jgi:copper chaperone CopZ
MSQSETTVFKVEDMSCDHCAARVKKAVLALAANSEVQVDLATGVVTVKPPAADPAAMAAAITDAGYPATMFEKTS